MPREKLENTLKELHETLQQSREVDPDDVALLRTLDEDIRRLLADETDTGPQGLTERAEALAARFRADHPALEKVVREIIDTLARIGV